MECSTFAQEFGFLAQNGYSAVAPKDDSKADMLQHQGMFKDLWNTVEL